jgi:hypothetical protein
MDMLIYGEIALIDEIAAIFNNKTELTNFMLALQHSCLYIAI